MTDEQIEKALEHCSTEEDRCQGCPYDDGDPDIFSCAIRLPKDALDLVKRQRKEIERLFWQLEDAKQCIYAIEDALDCGTDNDWAREAIRHWESIINETTEEQK